METKDEKKLHNIQHANFFNMTTGNYALNTFSASDLKSDTVLSYKPKHFGDPKENNMKHKRETNCMNMRYKF